MIAKIIAWFRPAKPEPLTVAEALRRNYVAQFSNDPDVRKAASVEVHRAFERQARLAGETP